MGGGDGTAAVGCVGCVEGYDDTYGMCRLYMGFMFLEGLTKKEKMRRRRSRSREQLQHTNLVSYETAIHDGK